MRNRDWGGMPDKLPRRDRHDPLIREGLQGLSILVKVDRIYCWKSSVGPGKWKLP